ncbi:hypothetical protein N7478_012831 [Penicillium angulare]|uniref:uncharacterized protein n=1 Tax=Penicillium angulare TaxID=116970 RepID=UPI00254248A4|nr:uncharacterized protein N7478_012831 [Penicillium angulare]KAJ5256727.1 hypothetical protein N7478_012831 [Penicillium angulare]
MTGTSSTEGLELAQIVFYATAFIPAFFCFAKHGKHGLAGWLYVMAMCGLRLVGNGMAYHSLSTTGKPNPTAQIISGIGLSPILLAALGILHEANYSIQQRLPAILQGAGLLVPHLTILAGIALSAASKGKSSLLEAGMGVLALGWLMIVVFTAISLRSDSNRRRIDHEKKLLFAVTVALPLLGIRVIYSFAVAFADGRVNGGSLAVQAIFGTIPEFLVMIIYISAGIVTRNLTQERAGVTKSEPLQQDLMETPR